MMALRHAAAFAILCVAALLGGCGGGAPAAPGTTSAASPTPAPDLGPPNIVLILADDMGWGDLGSYGNTQIRTPNLDQMAAEGARFTSFYVDAPVCAPSRAALMTGQWPPRTGIVWNPPHQLRDGEVVVAQPLHDRGYATGMVGKWHLGWEPQDMPIHYGFDYFYGDANGEDSSDFILGDQPTKDTVSQDQLAKRYTDYALKYIAAHIGPDKDRRFFMYIAEHDPHLPNNPDPAWAGKSGAGAYGDVIEALDEQIGVFMQGLKDLGIDENTLVVFTSDNGPVKPPGSSGPFNGRKGSCEEGGIREPAIMRWPARIRRGQVISEPVSTLDLFPTFVALAGATLPARPYDGQDISALITGAVDHIPGKGVDGGREIVFWQEYGQPGALRSGRYKYLRPGLWNTHPTLFDLEADPGERSDLTPSRPDLSKQLEQRLQDILAGQ